MKNNIFLFLAGALFLSVPALAQGAPSALSVEYARRVAVTCIEAWDQPACLALMSSSNFALAGAYGTDLQNRGMEPAAETIKQHCAASTAAREQAYPADAVRSAFVECANTISDVAGQTGVKPDAGLYQLLVGSVMCLNHDRGCPTVEFGLKAYLN